MSQAEEQKRIVAAGAGRPGITDALLGTHPDRLARLQQELESLALADQAAPVTFLVTPVGMTIGVHPLTPSAIGKDFSFPRLVPRGGRDPGSVRVLRVSIASHGPPARRCRRGPDPSRGVDSRGEALAHFW